jgi:hypothetical protein
MEKIRLLATAGVLGTVATGLAATGCSTATRTVVVTAPAKVVTATPAAVPKTTTTAAPAASSTAPSTAVPATTTPAAPASSAPAAAPVPTPAAAPLTNPSAVVTQFYQDISDGDYSAAWALGGDNLSGGASYATWVAGYQDTTASIAVVSSSNYNSDTAYAEIDATQLDGSVNTYSGTYTVRGGVIVSADITQTS